MACRQGLPVCALMCEGDGACGMQARARVELRESASAQDAKDVVEIMKFRQVLHSGEP